MFENDDDDVHVTFEASLKDHIEPNDSENHDDYVEVEMRSWKIIYIANQNNIKIQPDDFVIFDVDRGQDIGRVLNTSVKGKKYIDHFGSGKVLSVIRTLTENDMSSLHELEEREKLAAVKFVETLVKYNFEMKLIDTVYQFDGNKVTFFFTADGRIDFREFVRELAQIFKTRIELHQSTGRDEAKKLGGYGMCGNEYCCSSFMKRFNQVTIKMAKDQNLSGNLSKISGPCGRLLCCLHFEEDFYAELSKDFPEMGDEIWVEGKKMYVFRNDFYAKVIYLTSETQEMSTITIEEYQKFQNKKQQRNKKDCDNCQCDNKPQNNE